MSKALLTEKKRPRVRTQTKRLPILWRVGLADESQPNLGYRPL